MPYTDGYWKSELASARERGFGPALARLAELVLYSRIPISRVLDVGTGAGYFLDAISQLLPENADRFFGIEKFPPPERFQSRNKNYIIGDITDVPFPIDAGLCVEVVEHLTPQMLKALFSSLAKQSTAGAIYLFNTGLAPHAIKNPQYLDPTIRGHIVSYSIDGIRALLEPTPFVIYPLRGRDWAFIAELDSGKDANEDLSNRIWSALPENISLLESETMGSALKLLGYESARAYH